jgi:hypothetical protein
MSNALYVGVAAAVILGLGYLLIRAAMKAASDKGAAEARAGASDDAREAEHEMTEIQSETVTPDELRKRIRDGTFGGQKP